MNRSETNEVLIGVGIIGIAAYFLWPKQPPVVMQGQAEPLAQLGGFAIPNLPAYLSANRPGFAIAPTPYQAFGGILPVQNAGEGNALASPYEPSLQPNLDMWPGNALLGLAPSPTGSLLGASISPDFATWPVTATRGDDPSLPQPSFQAPTGANGCNCC